MAWSQPATSQGSSARGISVASLNSKQFDPTEYTITSSGMFVVAKIAPKTTGEIRINYEAKTNALQNLTVNIVGANRATTTTAPLLVRNFSEADQISWLTPLGSSVSSFTESANTSIIALDNIASTVTTYTPFTHIVNVMELIPFYLCARNASVSGGPSNNIRNINVSYDILK